MPLYIPWLTETIKKRGVRYLLHHYLGQFFEEKLTLEQLSIDIYEGKGSIKDLALDVDGLNDELDFIPFKFLDGCLIGQISVEVPWSSLATEACKVELDSAKFICRLKTSADASKAHCTESTLLTRSLMTSSIKMAEDIVTTEDDEEFESPSSSMFKSANPEENKKDENQMFEGLEMFAQLIDSVLRRTKLTARNTLFQIKPHKSVHSDNEDDAENSSSRKTSQSDYRPSLSHNSDTSEDCESNEEVKFNDNSSKDSVEFFIRFFRCEEILESEDTKGSGVKDSGDDENKSNKPLSAIPEKVTKLLTLEDVEMRIGGLPVSNLIGRHTIMIKFNGQKSEISIFSGSPLLAVIGHEQLETFFKVFEGAGDENRSSPSAEKNQKVMSPEDYAKIENQLLESAPVRGVHHLNDLEYLSSNSLAPHGGRRWAGTGEVSYSNHSRRNSEHISRGYHSPNSTSGAGYDVKAPEIEPTLENIEAFSCELKLPGIWLCILKDGETLPPLIRPYADSNNSFITINKYIDEHIKIPHIRVLALKVSLDITAGRIITFLGDLDISEHLQDEMNPTLNILHNDLTNVPMSTARYSASVVNNKEINIEFMTRTKVVLDPTIIDRLVFDYKLFSLNNNSHKENRKQNNHHSDLNLVLKGDQFKVELLCPIPDLTPENSLKTTQLRPQSFIFDLKDISASWRSDKLAVSCDKVLAFVKTQPKQADCESIKFIEASSESSNKILFTLEPSPSNLDTAFPSEVEQALNESSMYDSIYVGQGNESQIPTYAFQTKRKVVRDQANKQQESTSSRLNDCDNEKIITPGDRDHLSSYLNQTVMSTKLSLSLHLPICEVEFEDKEQLDLIYNRFGNDFVFWQPKACEITSQTTGINRSRRNSRKVSTNSRRSGSDMNSLTDQSRFSKFRQALEDNEMDNSDDESEVSFHSLSIEGSNSDTFDNEVTTKVTVDELFVRFNHQHCAASMKQEISAQNLLLGVVIDVNKKPGTLVSLVADNLELSTDSSVVLKGNHFGDKNSIFGLTTEIKRPTRSLKDITLAIQLTNGLFNDFQAETFTRFWQSINVTDEPILGYVAPKIITELHIDILNTALCLVRDGARPALVSIDELYLNSMVVEQTSQVMLRLIADEVSLYLKRNKQGLEVMKNYICLVDSGLVDLDVKFSQDGKLEFEIINNVITVRVCQDSLSALCKLFSAIVKSNNSKIDYGVANSKISEATKSKSSRESEDPNMGMDIPDVSGLSIGKMPSLAKSDSDSYCTYSSDEDEAMNKNNLNVRKIPSDTRTKDLRSQGSVADREMNLLEDAMNDYGDTLARQSSSYRDEIVDKRHVSIAKSGELTPASDEQYNCDQSDENTSDDDSDGFPPILQSPMRLDNLSARRDPKACILDESNPMLGDLFSQPLVPSPEDNIRIQESTDSFATSGHQAIDESGFFVIGDDDVGAGIIDKMQREPMVRKLIDGPINIMENHFKMTKPRTIPEMLASSLERYVLEEMTLVVNLYGGRDFDDERDSAEVTNSLHEKSPNGKTNVTDDLTHETANVNLANGAEISGIRSRTESVTSTSARAFQGPNRTHCLSDSSGGSLRRFKSSGRRKNLSEGATQNDEQEKSYRVDQQQRVRFGEGTVNLWESLDLMSSPDLLSGGHNSDYRSNYSGSHRRPSQLAVSADSKLSGGTWRQTDVCIQLTLSKVKMLYELGDQNSPISWRFLLFIHDIEIKDRIHASDINKMLYEYCTESMPKRSTQILTIKNVATINPTDGCEECDLRVSLKPLRLNIDQDTLLFLIEFFTALSKSLEKQQSSIHLASGKSSAKLNPIPTGSSGQSLSKSSGLGTNSGNSSSANSTSQLDQMPGDNSDSGSGQTIRSRTNSTHSSRNEPLTSATNTTTTTTSSTNGELGDKSNLPTHCHSDNLAGSPNQQPIYIKSFTFSPDVPIRLDYHAKHLDFEQGALAGILMGLAHLDHSELVLRRVQAKHGMRGLDRVLLFTLNCWLSDIKRNQLPSILGGVGPMHSVIQLFQGMRDLVWMPIEHYRKDRRLVRGLQRGASSFSSSTAMAAINLVNRFISIVQCTAQIAHDIVTPPDLQSSSDRRGSCRSQGISGEASPGGNLASGRRRHVASCAAATAANSTCSSNTTAIVGINQPRNFCEGVAVGYTILKEGLNDTARNVAIGMQADDVRSAVGELVRQIPSTLLNPIISATEGAQNVLVGIRNQIAPDARREDQEKWKRRVRGK